MVVADINVEGAQKVADAIKGEGGNALAVRVDVSDPDSTKEMAAQTLSEFGGIDYLVKATRSPDRSDKLEAAARLADWTAPVRAELGLDIALPELNGAQRQRRMIDTGAPREEVFAAMVRETLETYAAEVVA